MNSGGLDLYNYTERQTQLQLQKQTIQVIQALSGIDIETTENS